MALDQRTETTIQSTEDDALVPMYAKREIALVRGEGYALWDSEGRRYLDFASGYGVSVLGHGNPAFTAAVAEQAGRLVSCHQSFYNDARAAYLERLRGILPAPLSRVFFNNSGAEAVEAALKFARAATGRAGFVSARGGYHGRTLGALSATPSKKYREPYEPLLDGFRAVPFGDVDALGDALAPDVAAVILEPVQGEAGIHPAPDGYLAAARELAHANGSLLILDEVQTAFRTGRWFGFEHWGVAPDLLCLSKGIANGFPMGLTVTTDEIASRLPAGTHGNTFGASPLAAAAALATLEEIERQDLLAHSAEAGAYLVDRLESIESPRIRQVRGKGLMVAVELRERSTRHLKALQERGILALPASSPTTLRFLPPLIMDRAGMDTLAETIDALLADGATV